MASTSRKQSSGATEHVSLKEQLASVGLKSAPSGPKGGNYNPNPFDFVPFPESLPEIKTPEEWGKLSDTRCSGYLDVRITALTPLHTVGKQDTADNKGRKITTSQFNQRQGVPLIQASTIRGCLRDFLEAACNGWASQLTPGYPKVKKRRQRAFVVTPELPDAKDVAGDLEDPDIPPAVKAEWYHDPDKNGRIDVASYLFGNVLPKEEGQKEGAAWKGRIGIEDAMITQDLVWASKDPTNHAYTLPDIPGDAFMGGGHPSASSWWYMHPYGIRLRRAVEFVGGRYRGRKFYYHQNPEQCVKWYFEKDSKGKPHWPQNPYHIRMQCLAAGQQTEPFRIYFDEIPEPLLHLLLFALRPGPTIRHSLGYGRAYGYGAVDFEAYDVTICPPRRAAEDLKHRLAESQARANDLLQNPDRLMQAVTSLTHHQSMEHLTRILGYRENSTQIFTYPPFGKGGFLPAVQRNDIIDLLSPTDQKRFNQRKMVTLTLEQAKEIATTLHQSGKRRALHFEVYQELAKR